MMKAKYVIFLLSLFFLITFDIQSQKAWKKIPIGEYEKNESELYNTTKIPQKYELFSLEISSLDNSLNKKSNTINTIIELPDANGKLQKFTVIETSNFESGLQEKFPDIRSYTAKGIDDPTATAKLSLGVDGFHGTIFSGEHATVYIDPHSKNNKDYIVYSRDQLSQKDLDFQCMVEDKMSKSSFDLSMNKVNDGKLRTYRLAMACSGEYAQFHLTRQNIASNASTSVKKAAVLSAMNTTMTRINGVFEKDLAVRMVLVNNNDNIIFLDPATDGITDDNINSAIGESQSICDARIGNSNYDIGHLLFTSGGQLNGLAGLGVVCVNNQKARGVTGLGNPVGDIFDIDLVAHELGHQFGATHTQNNDCNRTNETAVEVGSGVTIMGYSGICNPNVFGVGTSTGNSDDYFHAVSIAQMHQIIDTSGDCASLSDTNNATPTANAGLDYSIPKSTPFKLTGAATDANGLNSLTYNWDQIDNEIGTMPPQSTNSGGPMFRSLPSKTTPVRYFPDLTTVVGGSTASQWEVVPSVARELNFSFTVRDNNSGGGSTARDDAKIIVTSANAFTVTSQTSATTWNTGSSETITWNVGSTNVAPINCSTVNIRLSTDGGATFPILLKSGTPNDGSEVVIIPNNATSNARIMVEAADNVFYNVNAGNITINSTTPTFIIANTTGGQSVCNVGNQSATYTLNFDFVNGFSENVTLSATGNPAGSQVAFNPSTINSDGNVVMTISNLDGLTANNYTVNVKGTANSLTQNIDVNLQLTSSSFSNLTLVTPVNGSSNVPLAITMDWTADANANAYDVQIASDNGFSNIASSGTVATNNYIATNLDGSTQYFWRVRPKNNCGVGSYSSTFSFTTLDPSYCTSTYTDEAGGSEFISNVRFNTINNTSNNDTDDGYQDFTSISTNIKRGETYQASVTFNVVGFQDQCFIFIDWNKDFVFDPNTEKYDLGTHFSSSGGNIGIRNLNITVPNDARLGNTTMRVFIEYVDSPSFVPGAGACDTDQASEWGETEDYTLNIEDATASLDDVSFDKFNLFPNPNSGRFTLMFETIDTAKTTLELYDVRGRLVTKKVFTNTQALFREEINFNNLSKGLYLLKINNGDKQTARKLIIE